MSYSLVFMITIILLLVMIPPLRAEPQPGTSSEPLQGTVDVPL